MVETGKGSGWGIRQGEVGATREALMPGMHWTQKAGVISGGVQQKGVLNDSAGHITGEDLKGNGWEAGRALETVWLGILRTYSRRQWTY